MSKIIDMIASATALGIAGYFIYRVVLPGLKDIQFPTWQFPPFPTLAPPQQQQQAPQPQQDTGDSKSKSPPSSPSPQQPLTATASGTNTPQTLGYKGTGQKVAMEVGGDPAGNGQRYNVNHKFKNYLIIGYFLIGDGQQQIEHKTDGPHHGGCT